MSAYMPFLNREVLQRIEERAVDILQELERRLIAEMLDSKGMAYGDIELPPEEAMLKFVDDEARGVNSWLAQNEPEEWIRRQREFIKNAEDGGVA